MDIARTYWSRGDEEPLLTQYAAALPSSLMSATSTPRAAIAFCSAKQNDAGVITACGTAPVRP